MKNEVEKRIKVYETEFLRRNKELDARQHSISVKEHELRTEGYEACKREFMQKLGVA